MISLQDAIMYGGNYFLEFSDLARLSGVSINYKKLSLWCFDNVKSIEMKSSNRPSNQTLKDYINEKPQINHYIYSRLNHKKITYVCLLVNLTGDLTKEFILKCVYIIDLQLVYINDFLRLMLPSCDKLETVYLVGEIKKKDFQMLHALPNIRVIGFEHECKIDCILSISPTLIGVKSLIIYHKGSFNHKGTLKYISLILCCDHDLDNEQTVKCAELEKSNKKIKFSPCDCHKLMSACHYHN